MNSWRWQNVELSLVGRLLFPLVLTPRIDQIRVRRLPWRILKAKCVLGTMTEGLEITLAASGKDVKSVVPTGVYWNSCQEIWGTLANPLLLKLAAVVVSVWSSAYKIFTLFAQVCRNEINLLTNGTRWVYCTKQSRKGLFLDRSLCLNWPKSSNCYSVLKKQPISVTLIESKNVTRGTVHIESGWKRLGWTSLQSWKIN